MRSIGSWGNDRPTVILSDGIHPDPGNTFIRAEIIKFGDLFRLPSGAVARDAGFLR